MQPGFCLNQVTLARILARFWYSVLGCLSVRCETKVRPDLANNHETDFSCARFFPMIVLAIESSS